MEDSQRLGMRMARSTSSTTIQAAYSIPYRVYLSDSVQDYRA